MSEKHTYEGIRWSVSDGGVLMVELGPEGDGTIPVLKVVEEAEEVEVDNGEERTVARDRVLDRRFPWQGCAEDIVEVRVCEGITSVPKGFLRGMNRLVRVLLPASLRTIEQEAFAGSVLESVLITHGLETVGPKAFEGCLNLKAVDLPSTVTGLGNRAFCACPSLERVRVKGNVGSIGERTFWNCCGLKTVELCDSITTIGDSAFLDCKGLDRIALPAGLVEIGEFAFSGCKRLRAIDIPEGVVKIGKQAFFNCASLERVSLPDSIIDVGHAAFSACDSLRDVTLPRGFEDIVDAFGFGFPRQCVTYRRKKLFSGLFGKK